MKELEITKMTLEDFYEIKDILEKEFDDFWTPSILKDEILGENKIYIVAKINNCIVGFIGILKNGLEWEIMNIVTRKSQREKGIATHLLNKIIQIAKNNNVEKIILEVNTKNDIAQKLYKNVGFTEIGIRKKYYHLKDDAIIMSKNINNL